MKQILTLVAPCGILFTACSEDTEKGGMIWDFTNYEMAIRTEEKSEQAMDGVSVEYKGRDFHDSPGGGFGCREVRPRIRPGRLPNRRFTKNYGSMAYGLRRI